MKTKWVFVVMAVALGPGAPWAGARTWTSASGATVEAEYEGVQGNFVVLRKSTGEKIMILLQQLSEEDQAFVREQLAPKTPAPPTPTGPHRGREGRAARPVQVPSTTPPVLTPEGPGSKEKRKGGAHLTEDEVAALKKELVVDATSGEKLEFVGGMSPKKHLGEKERDWKEGDPIPVTITCELVRVRPKKGAEVERKRVTSGTGVFYITNEQGDVVLEGKESLEKLQPESDLGYKGELPKPGKYTLVIYTEYKGTRLGVTETLDVRAPQRR